jgi:hypothetical protein
MNGTFWLGTLALILISVTGCDEVKLPVNTYPVSADIESPLRNTCQSGELDPTFPKCQDEDSPTFTSATSSMLSPSTASAERLSFHPRAAD